MILRRAGVLCFLTGALATLVTIGIWLVSGRALPVPAYLTAMLMPLGLLLVGIDFIRAARRSIH